MLGIDVPQAREQLAKLDEMRDAVVRAVRHSVDTTPEPTVDDKAGRAVAATLRALLSALRDEADGFAAGMRSTLDRCGTTIDMIESGDNAVAVAIAPLGHDRRP